MGIIYWKEGRYVIKLSDTTSTTTTTTTTTNNNNNNNNNIDLIKSHLLSRFTKLYSKMA